MLSVTEAKEWNKAVSAHLSGHLLQSFSWGELKARFGWPEPVRVLWDKPSYRGAQILFRKLPLGFTIGYVPKGPWGDWTDEGMEETLAGIKEIARKRRAIAVILEPNAPDEQALKSKLRSLGLLPTRAIQPRSTIKIPLDAEEEEILARMHRKTRYNIRLSARKGVVVKDGTQEDIPRFYRLMKETSARDGFPIHSLDYYMEAYNLLTQSGYGRLLLAYYEGEIIAGIMVSSFGNESIYLYGASSSSHRDKMPNHALQWEAIKWAKSKGCLYYDLWGIPDEVGIAPHKYSKMGDYGRGGLWGVYRFKLGFGGVVVRSVGAWIADVLPGGSLIYKTYLLRRKA